MPARGLRELARLLADPAEVVEIRLESNRIGFEAGGAHVLVRLIDGAFPDYRAVIPAAAATRAIVETAEAAAAPSGAPPPSPATPTARCGSPSTPPATAAARAA